MAGEVERLSGKLGIDTTDFKTGVRAADRELRVLESGFKASAAALGDWTKDATGLESRIKSLTSQIDIQKLKVDALRAEHQRLSEANGAGSKAAQEAEIKLNKETETLNKMSTELDRTQVALVDVTTGENQVGDAAQEMGSDVDEGGSKMEGFKTVLGGVGTVLGGVVTGILAVGAAAVATVGLMGGLVFSSAEAAGGLVDLSAKTGISVERLQELDFISHQIGVSLDTITGAQSRLVRSMASSADGTGEQAKSFDTLGIKVKDAQGNLRDTQTVFAETLDALSKIENPAERDALAMSLFGKSAQELNPLIKTSADEMERLTDKAHEMGAVMSDEDVAALEAFDDTLASLQSGLKGTLGTLATAFLPGFQSVFDQVGGYLKTFTDIVSGADGDFGKIATGLTGLVTQIATDVAQQAPAMLQAGLGIVKAILDAITTALPAMLEAGIAILKSLLDFIVASLPTLIDAGIKIILFLVDALVANLPMLVDAALQAVIALANGLAAALPELIPAIIEALILIVNTLVENAPMLIEAATALILGLTEGIIAALPILIPAIPAIIKAIIDALIVALPQIATAGGQLIGMLASGFFASYPLLGDAIIKVMDLLLKTLFSKKLSLVDIGKDFIGGLIDGIKSASGYLFDAVKEVVEDMLQSIKDALLMKSPSRKGKEIGRNLGLSLPLGMQEVMGDIQRSFAGMTNQLAGTVAGSLGGSSAVSSSVNTNNIPVYGNVYLQGSTTPDSLGDALVKRY